MKKIKVEMFEAEDGKKFETEVACREYELTSGSLTDRIMRMLSKASEPQLLVDSAIRYDGWARPFAALMEEAGKKCAEARIAAGDRKRKPKDKTDGAPKVGEGVREAGPINADLGPVDHKRHLPTAGPDEQRYPTPGNRFPLHGENPSTGTEG